MTDAFNIAGHGSERRLSGIEGLSESKDRSF